MTMTEWDIHGYLVLAIFASAVLTFVLLLSMTAPYGRHIRAGWGPTVPARVGWLVMESPASLLFAGVYVLGAHAQEVVPLVFFALWQLHYINRTFVFPFRLRESGKRMPVSIIAMAIVFNGINAYVNARWVSHFGTYPEAWLTSAPFMLGALCFSAGFLINQHADAVLMRLRQPGETGYKIPRGGLYRWVSCPNYLGEILEWAGWALATWSLAGTAFAVFTAANLLPRALANHRWYREQFADYPSTRRALLPYLL
jgi:protein-S-isoprenylcysteine O-methyltransferase Ste14